MLRPEPVSELVEEPDEPAVLSVELLPLVPLVDELPVVSPVAAAPELLPGVVIVSDAPLLLMPEVLEPEELPVAGCSDVVVVVVTELLPDAAPEPDDAASLVAGSCVIVVVVVVCPNVAVAVPISDRKMAIGNFFMLAP